MLAQKLLINYDRLGLIASFLERDCCENCSHDLLVNLKPIALDVTAWNNEGRMVCEHNATQLKGGESKMMTFDDLLSELRLIHDGKNHDYAGARSGDPLDNFKKVGERVVCEYCHKPVGPVVAGQVLRTTKDVRLENLMLREGPQNESIKDSLRDNAVYNLLEILVRYERHAQGEREMGRALMERKIDDKF